MPSHPLQIEKESTTNIPATTRTPRWQQRIWLGSGVGLLLMIFALLIFVGLTASDITNIIVQRKEADLGFVFAGMSLVTLTLLRLLAILIGAAIAFAGLAVSFFAHENATMINAQTANQGSEGAKATLAAYSPGIVGVVIGAVIIIFALFSKSEHSYKSPQTHSMRVPSLATDRTARTPSEQNLSGESLERSHIRSLEEVLGQSASQPKK